MFFAFCTAGFAGSLIQHGIDLVELECDFESNIGEVGISLIYDFMFMFMAV